LNDFLDGEVDELADDGGVLLEVGV